MRLKCRVQHSLVTAHRTEDDGNFVFVICRRGFESAMNRIFKIGESVFVDVELKPSKNDADVEIRPN